MPQNYPHTPSKVARGFYIQTHIRHWLKAAPSVVASPAQAEWPPVVLGKDGP